MEVNEKRLEVERQRLVLEEQKKTLGEDETPLPPPRAWLCDNGKRSQHYNRCPTVTATFITILNILYIKYLHLRYKLDKLCYVVLYIACIVV